MTDTDVDTDTGDLSTDDIAAAFIGQAEFFISKPTFKGTSIMMTMTIPKGQREMALQLVDMEGLMIVGKFYEKAATISTDGLLTEGEIRNWYAKNVVSIKGGGKMIRGDWVTGND